MVPVDDTRVRYVSPNTKSSEWQELTARFVPCTQAYALTCVGPAIGAHTDRIPTVAHIDCAGDEVGRRRCSVGCRIRWAIRHLSSGRSHTKYCYDEHQEQNRRHFFTNTRQMWNSRWGYGEGEPKRIVSLSLVVRKSTFGGSRQKERERIEDVECVALAEIFSRRNLKFRPKK